MAAEFVNLNDGWNADPNDPDPEVWPGAYDVVLRFNLNHFQYERFSAGDRGLLRFIDCERYRLGGPNDEGWYAGQCRFSRLAPEWGEFYEVTGDTELLDAPDDWIEVGANPTRRRHFLFYFKDNTFECIAETCQVEMVEGNALFRAGIILID